MENNTQTIEDTLYKFAMKATQSSMNYNATWNESMGGIQAAFREAKQSIADQLLSLPELLPEVIKHNAAGNEITRVATKNATIMEIRAAIIKALGTEGT